MNEHDPERRYVALPGLVLKRNGDDVYVGNEVARTGIECSAGVLGALALLEKPISLGAIARGSGLSVEAAIEILAPLIDALLVVPEEAMAALATGPVRMSSRSIGQHLPLESVRQDGKPGAFAILGAPTGVGGGPDCMPSHGPSLVRNAFPDFLPSRARTSGLRDKWGIVDPPICLIQDLDFRRQYLPEDMPRVFDVGDVIYETGEGLETYGARLRFVTDRIASAGMRPITIGGDHSITRYTAGALLGSHRQFGIIHFDAHHDLYQGLPPKRLSHANPFSYLMSEDRICVMLQVGLRAAFERVRRGAIPIHDPRLQYVSALECQSRCPRDVFAHLPRDVPFYLSFDVDVVDPVYAPETGTPELGGLGYYQCLMLVDYVARHFDLIGADIVEVSGSGERRNAAARIGSRMLAQILLGRSRFDRLETYLYQTS
jgi:arginase family enzyme